MKAYRVQDENGYGPYTAYYDNELCDVLMPDVPLLLCKMFSEHDENYHLWPTAYQDNLEYYVGHDERHGFISEAQLYNWFTEANIKELASIGFCIVVLDVEILAIGKNQIIFKTN